MIEVHLEAQQPESEYRATSRMRKVFRGVTMQVINEVPRRSRLAMGVLGINPM